MDIKLKLDDIIKTSLTVVSTIPTDAGFGPYLLSWKIKVEESATKILFLANFCRVENFSKFTKSSFVVNIDVPPIFSEASRRFILQAWNFKTKFLTSWVGDIGRSQGDRGLNISLIGELKILQNLPNYREKFMIRMILIGVSSYFFFCRRRCRKRKNYRRTGTGGQRIWSRRLAWCLVMSMSWAGGYPPVN